MSGIPRIFISRSDFLDSFANSDVNKDDIVTPFCIESHLAKFEVLEDDNLPNVYSTVQGHLDYNFSGVIFQSRISKEHEQEFLSLKYWHNIESNYKEFFERDENIVYFQHDYHNYYVPIDEPTSNDNVMSTDFTVRLDISGIKGLIENDQFIKVNFDLKEIYSDTNNGGINLLFWDNFCFQTIDPIRTVSFYLKGEDINNCPTDLFLANVFCTELSGYGYYY
jgi:hypothetical protein